MEIEWILLTLIVVAAASVSLLLSYMLSLGRPAKKRSKRQETKHYNSGLHGIEGRSPIRGDQQTMYQLLTETLPDHIVLGKVAFTALMTTDNEDTHKTLSTKTADFVVCGKDFGVVAVVFLDPEGGKGGRNRPHNARLDAIMRRAGHRVLRYTEVPKRTKLAVDIKRPPEVERRRVRVSSKSTEAAAEASMPRYGERRHQTERRSGITYFDDNFVERRHTPDRRERHANVTHMGGFIERHRMA